MLHGLKFDLLFILNSGKQPGSPRALTIGAVVSRSFKSYCFVTFDKHAVSLKLRPLVTRWDNTIFL